MSTTKLRKVEDTFSERLKMLRLERGWSQEDLAARLEVSAGSVGNWEIGPHVPHPKTLKKIAGMFEVEVPYLLYGERDEIPRPAAMHEQKPEYGGVNLADLLREVEEARDRLDHVAQQLKRATKPSAAAALAKAAATSYDEKQSGAEKNQKPVDFEGRQTSAKTENRHSK